MKQNLGYRAGTQTRRFIHWLNVWENEMQQAGVPRWVTKIPLYLCIATAVGLLIVGAFFIAFFLALMVFIAWYLKTAAEGLSNPLPDGYHYSGPEGPGEYRNGVLVDDDD
ncbi:TPA: DUF3742 family protein [Citrobacter freundii]|nr:DUF3742 family protein [Citrobacter freundii]